MHLEYVYSQRSATKAGLGDLYVAPLNGNGRLTAARAAGMHEVRSRSSCGWRGTTRRAWPAG